MSAKLHPLLNTGIYSVREASRLAHVSPQRVRRWILGYDYKTAKGKRHSNAVFHVQHETIDGQVALGFLDLVEIKFVDAFLRAGVGWKTMRQAREKATGLLGVSHPFCTHKFMTDGKELFLELTRGDGETSLVEMKTLQQAFPQVLKQFCKQFDFQRDGVISRWRPPTTRSLIVLDPARSFGHPLVDRSGIPTDVLAGAFKAYQSVREVAHWYEVAEEDVEDAVEFEQQLAA